jgi:hypothetical protein
VNHFSLDFLGVIPGKAQIHPEIVSLHRGTLSLSYTETTHG